MKKLVILFTIMCFLLTSSLLYAKYVNKQKYIFNIQANEQFEKLTPLIIKFKENPLIVYTYNINSRDFIYIENLKLNFPININNKDCENFWENTDIKRCAIAGVYEDNKEFIILVGIGHCYYHDYLDFPVMGIYIIEREKNNNIKPIIILGFAGDKQ